MEPIVRLLRPLFLPLLKVELSPPLLPEGNTLVRTLRPSPRWLAYSYLQTVFGFVSQLGGLVVALGAVIAKAKLLGLALGAMALLGELAAIGLALVVTRVDFELRFALIGDRSLRMVHGAWRRQEVTLSYANVQNVEVNQGPLERLFGFKSLTISTAGADHQPGAEHSHLVTLVGLDDADEVRTLIMGIVATHRDSGLGEGSAKVTTALPVGELEALRAAAFELREAARFVATLSPPGSDRPPAS